MNTPPPKESSKLTSYFSRSAAIVQGYFTSYDIHSVYKSADSYFHEQPIVFTFVTIFTLLSFIPLAFFLCVCVFILIAFCATGLACALLASGGIILGLSGFLATILFGIFLTSIFFTATSLSSYYFLCLLLRLRRQGPPANATWSETATIHTPLHQPSHGDNKEPNTGSRTDVEIWQ